MKIYDVKLDRDDGARVLMSQVHIDKNGQAHGVFAAYYPTSESQGLEIAKEDLKLLLNTEHKDCQILNEMPEISSENKAHDIKEIEL